MEIDRLFLLLASLLLLEHLLHDLLLLDEECAHDTVADAVTASRATVGALDGLLGLGDLGVLAGAEGGDLCVVLLVSWCDLHCGRARGRDRDTGVGLPPNSSWFQEVDYPSERNSAHPAPSSRRARVSNRPSPRRSRMLSNGTYARELGAAVTALGDGASLLDVQQAELTTGGLDDTGPVGSGVVAVWKKSPVSISVACNLVASCLSPNFDVVS